MHGFQIFPSFSTSPIYWDTMDVFFLFFLFRPVCDNAELNRFGPVMGRGVGALYIMTRHERYYFWQSIQRAQQTVENNISHDWKRSEIANCQDDGRRGKEK